MLRLGSLGPHAEVRAWPADLSRLDVIAEFSRTFAPE
jgi:hypothetical protein